MTREEWYKSKEFKINRLLGNIAAEIIQKLQQVDDILGIVSAENLEIIVNDKYTLVDRQIRLMHSEGRRLETYVFDLARRLEPKLDEQIPGPV